MGAVAGVVALAAFATSVISAVFGMAGGMILMGLYAATLPVRVAMVLHGVTQLFANGFRAFLLRERIYAPGGRAVLRVRDPLVALPGARRMRLRRHARGRSDPGAAHRRALPGLVRPDRGRAVALIYLLRGISELGLLPAW